MIYVQMTSTLIGLPDYWITGRLGEAQPLPDYWVNERPPRWPLGAAEYHVGNPLPTDTATHCRVGSMSATHCRQEVTYVLHRPAPRLDSAGTFRDQILPPADYTSSWCAVALKAGFQRVRARSSSITSVQETSLGED